MGTVVIPWFLALTSFAALNNPDIRTDTGPDYGPEFDHGLVYVYDVEYDFISAPEIFIESYYNTNFTSTLSCRPRNASVLSCIFGEGILQIEDIKQHTLLQRKISAAKEYFEIDFNEAGVVSLRLPNSPSWDMSDEISEVNKLRIIGSLLNVGTDFDKHKSFSFTTNETSFLGACETVVTIVESSCPENPNKGNFRLRSIFHDTLGDSFLLRKRRNTRKCDRPYETSTMGDTENDETTVTSSYSEMRVCPEFFESTIIMEGKTINVKKGGKASTFQQVNKIRLRNVERAKEDLPTFVANSAIGTIYLHKNIQNNNIEV